MKIGNHEVTGMVYIMNLQAQANLPSEQYYDTVKKGYEDCGLDTAYLEAAMKRTEAEMAECQTVSANEEEDWEETESDDDFNEDEDEEYNPCPLHF